MIKYIKRLLNYMYKYQNENIDERTEGRTFCLNTNKIEKLLMVIIKIFHIFLVRDSWSLITKRKARSK